MRIQSLIPDHLGIPPIQIGREPLLGGNLAVELPMSRQDIRDYLGLTIETVSRTLTNLEHKAAIALPSSRRIVLRNRSALSRLNA